jgi:peptide methionine sulfoxide reductase msrA/msrB
VKWILIVLVAVLVSSLVWAFVENDSASETTEDNNGLTSGGEMDYKELTEEEKRVIWNKGTERAFTGQYWDHHEDGTYTCKQCGARLFDSDAKFDSGTGWPSFDNAIEGAVKEVPDADGWRTEIICAQCGGHLGHVFKGEGFTSNDTRHCVNSISLCFLPESSGTETAVYAGGCFWGMEYHFSNVPGVISTTVGYTGGHTDNPTYREVCSHTTGHIEALEVVYDPAQTSYEELTRLFFNIHDPTQVNRQGPDIGEQYKSAIFYMDEEQRKIAELLMAELEEKGYDVATELIPSTTFWEAEDYHQDYYQKKDSQPYCHIYTQRL